jgi:ferric-dicitrate binding protein FerR (iron transport regulator)
MNEFNNIPENDPDLILARQYGEVLEGNITPSGIDDALLDLLFRAQSEAESAEREIPVAGQGLSWDKIQKSISKSDTKQGARIHSLSSAKKWYWAAAAVILIAFSSILLLQQTYNSDPKLIAESGSSLSIIELADGSSVTLRPNSILYELSVTDNSHNYSLTGEGLFDVESLPGRTFSVEAGPGRVVVTGTRFNLSDRNQQSAVYLIGGSIQFETSDRQQTISMAAGEAAIIDQQYRLLDPFSFDSDEITGWTQNRLTFRDREAASIISELEFHFDISIRAPDEINQITLGGSIPLDSPEQSLEDLGTVLGGSFEQTGESTYQFRPGL